MSRIRDVSGRLIRQVLLCAASTWLVSNSVCCCATSKRLAVIGGMGTMLSPSASHLAASSFARVAVAHARASANPGRVKLWLDHGALLVPSIDEVLCKDVDALLLCVGKNGDDLPILKETCAAWANSGRGIFHLSTVSPSFARAAAAHCRRQGLRYVNYPLTGGPTGAQQATMLLLASGDKGLYDEYLPLLESIGRPRYFGQDDGRGAEVKLQGQMMVFGGLLGISSAAATSFAVSGTPVGQSAANAEFLDFLNGGAGSTRQWDVAVSRGVRDGDWTEGFQVSHAVVDAIYAADMSQKLGLSSITSRQLLITAGSLAYLLQSGCERLATQAIAKELHNSPGLESFMAPVWSEMGNFKSALEVVISMLPPKIRDQVLLNVTERLFQS
ncbi:unnamed protein product [Effrenium voratum]|nr:unnamed protein product [Effrenium voratum]